MSKNEVFVGVDTSNYTTSFAIIDGEGELVANLKRPLPVKEGERGLRQSEAVFSHVKNIPSLMSEAEGYLAGKRILAVGVSEKPRRVEGSYMPCFLAGLASAESISRTSGVPLYKFSHQCGHVMAALYSSKAKIESGETFCAFHVSGGTTECLLVKREDGGFKADLIGGTLDLNAGQIIDRIGVKIGLSFPAGPHMEALALDFKGDPVFKRPKVKDTFVNLSGLENMAERMLKETGDKNMTAAFVLHYVADVLVGITECALQRHGQMPLLYAGGVMCNSIIKARIYEKYPAYFATPSMSSDNAVGIAALAMEEYRKQNEA